MSWPHFSLCFEVIQFFFSHLRHLLSCIIFTFIFGVIFLRPWLEQKRLGKNYPIRKLKFNHSIKIMRGTCIVFSLLFSRVDTITMVDAQMDLHNHQVALQLGYIIATC